MDTKEPAAIGIFDNLEKAEHTIDELRQAGFQSDEIGIIGHVNPDGAVPTPAQMHMPEENTATALAKGGVLGAVIGALVIAVIPGLGLVSGMGHWFEIVGGAALGAAAGGALIAFGSLFFSSSRTRFYAEELEKGRFIVTVKNPGRKHDAITVLRRQGIHTEDVSD